MEYTARKVYEAIKKELHGRRACGWEDHVDEEIAQEIEEALLARIGEALQGEAISVNVAAASIAEQNYQSEAGALVNNLEWQQLLHQAREDAAEVEQLRVQLAGVLVAAGGGTSENVIAHKGQYGWSPAYQETLDLRTKYDTLVERIGRDELDDTITDQVAAFHQAFDYPVRFKPVEHFPESELRLRLSLVVEEAIEFVNACGYSLNVETVTTDEGTYTGEINMQLIHTGKPNIVEIADALGDLDYVVEGTRLTWGIPRQAVADEIQRSNMAKVGGPRDPNTGKQLKPANWTPPDIAGVLGRAQLSE